MELILNVWRYCVKCRYKRLSDTKFVFQPKKLQAVLLNDSPFEMISFWRGSNKTRIFSYFKKIDSGFWIPFSNNYPYPEVKFLPWLFSSWWDNPELFRRESPMTQETSATIPKLFPSLPMVKSGPSEDLIHTPIHFHSSMHILFKAELEINNVNNYLFNDQLHHN